VERILGDPRARQDPRPLLSAIVANRCVTAVYPPYLHPRQTHGRKIWSDLHNLAVTLYNRIQSARSRDATALNDPARTVSAAVCLAYWCRSASHRSCAQ